DSDTTAVTNADAAGTLSVTTTESLKPVTFSLGQFGAPQSLADATDPGADPDPGKAPARPLLIIPGIAGTFAANGFRTQWFTQRGVTPDKLQVDPLGQYYHYLVRTLRDVGYTLDQDLFVANYDWRMNPGPIDPVNTDLNLLNDKFDGTIDGLTAGASTPTAHSITDGTYVYGVDYLGYWLKLASDRWAANHANTRPISVDIISHSTGGLIARTYIQSGAYGGATPAGDLLPKVNNLTMVGVPNRGAAKAWNVLHDDWNVEPAFALVLSKVVNVAYSRLMDPLDPDYTGVITGPDYDILGTPLTADPNPATPNIVAPSKLDFITAYIPTARGLLATYPFLDLGTNAGVQTVNTNLTGAGARNAFVLDLNAGLDVDYTEAQIDASPTHSVVVGGQTRNPDDFIDQLLGKAIVIYGDEVKTPVAALKHI